MLTRILNEIHPRTLRLDTRPVRNGSMALFFGTNCAESDDMTWQPPEPLITAAGMRLYTLDQLLAVRQQTIEECAKVVEEADVHVYTWCGQAHEDGAKTLGNAADAIRKLGGLT